MTRELGVAAEALDRADLGEQLRGRDRRAAGQFEQRRRELCGPAFEFLVDLGDRPVELADGRDELAGEPPYLEGAMTPEQMTALELHLNFCDGCFAFVDQVRTTAAMARVLPEEEIPDEIRAKLLEAFNHWRRE